MSTPPMLTMEDLHTGEVEELSRVEAGSRFMIFARLANDQFVVISGRHDTESDRILGCFFLRQYQFASFEAAVSTAVRAYRAKEG